MVKLTAPLFALASAASLQALPSELPLSGRAKGLVDLQGKCLSSNYMHKTSHFAGGGCPEYVRGVQIFVEWADVEPEHGSYNFSALESQLEEVASLDKFAVIKLNGGRKPGWMYDRIPQNNEIWSAENFDNTTLMYWHPLFISSYLNLIDAYATFLKQMDQSHDGLIAYVRMNFDAVGTETMGIPSNSPARDMSTWFAPAGCTSNCSAVELPWSKELDADYRKRVLDQHLNSPLGSLGKLLLRNNIVSDIDISYLAPSLRKHKAGFFHTGAAMEENQVFNQDWRYSVFQDWTLPGTTFGFSEQAGFWQYTAKWPLDPKDSNVGVFSKVQFAYWLMLSGLHNGVSGTGLHFDPMMYSPGHAGEVDRVPLNDTRYINAYRFYDLYAGYHAHPGDAPGAWIAFRGKGDNFPGDYRFLMGSASTPSDFDLGQTAVGDRGAPFGAWCKALSPSTSASFKTELAGDISRVQLRLVWFDDAGASWTLKYSNTDGSLATAMHRGGGGSGEWLETTVLLADAQFKPSASKHLLLESTGAAAVRVHMIEVRRVEQLEGSRLVVL